MSRRPRLIFLSFLSIFLLNLITVSAQTEEQVREAMEKGVFFPDQQKVMELFWGLDGNGRRDFEEIAKEMGKSLEKIYDLYGDAAILIQSQEIRQQKWDGVIAGVEKTKINLSLRQEELVELYKKYSGNLDEVAEEMGITRKGVKKHLAVIEAKLEALPEKIKADVDLLDIMTGEEYGQYFTPIQKTIAVLHLWQEGQPPLTPGGVADRLGYSRATIEDHWQKAQDRVRSLPDILKTEAKLRELIGQLTKQLTDQGKDLSPAKRKAIETEIKAIEKFLAIKDGKRPSGEEIGRAIGKNESTARRIIRAALKEIGYLPDSEKSKEILKEVEQRVVQLSNVLQKEQALAEKFRKYWEYLTLDQQAAVSARINLNDGSTKQGRSGAAEQTGMTKGKISSLFLRAKETVERLAREGAPPPRELTKYKEVPFVPDYEGAKEGGSLGFQIKPKHKPPSSRPRLGR